MPRIKTQPQPFEKVSQLLKGRDLNAPRLAQILNRSDPTARNKLNNPELFTLGELKTISRRAGIPWDEFRQVI